MTLASIRPCYTLDVDEAIRSIARFNSSETMAASEHLLDQHFSSVAATLDATTVAQRVVLLDGLWATQLFREPGASERIVQSLRTNAKHLIEVLEQLQPDALERDPDTVVRTACETLPFIIQHSPDAEEAYRQNYSFATKFLHWTTRAHFPIMDGKSRKRISDIQSHQNVKGRVCRNSSTPSARDFRQDYPRWIRFYSDMIHSLTGEIRESLLRADHDWQIPAYRISNSLLRVLDKVLYAQGGATGLGRFQPST